MSTAHPSPIDTLLLVDGQRLSQPEFHARYEAIPPGIWAELVDGVVCMSSPVGPVHSGEHFAVIAWLSRYQGFTPGVRGHDNALVILDDRTEVQPDALLRIDPTAGGQTQAETAIWGAPELVVEVAHSTKRLDLGPKLAEYERAGVLDYIVRLIEPNEVRWFALREGQLVRIEPDADGLYRSTTFPGLWLDPVALIDHDLPGLWAVVDQGTATPEHAAFVARLAQGGRGQ